MTPFQRWQQEKYGSYTPEVQTFDHDEQQLADREHEQERINEEFERAMDEFWND